MGKTYVLVLILLAYAQAFAQENLYRVTDNANGVSYMDKTGKLIFKADITGTDPIYFGDYRHGYLTVNYSKTKKAAIFDNKGLKVFETDSLYLVEEPRFSPSDKYLVIAERMKKGIKEGKGPAGIIDAKGNFTIPLSRMNYGILYAGQNMFVRMYGPNYIDLIDEHGNFIERYDAENFSRSSHNFFISEGLIPFRYKAMDFKDILPPKNTIVYGKWGYMDSKKNMIIAPKFGWAGGFSEGFALVETNDNEYNIINKKGEFILKGDFDSPIVPPGNVLNWEPKFVGGLANVCVVNKTDETKTVKCGYIDSLAKWRIQPQYIFASQFSEGLAMVVDKNHKTLFINKTGKTVLEGFWDNEGHNNCRWDKNLIYVGTINTYFNHKGQKIGKPATANAIAINSPAQLLNLSEKDLLFVESIFLTSKQINENPGLMDKVYKCKSVRDLYLGGRDIDGGYISFDDLYKLTKLENLRLDGLSISSLPNGISQLKKLKELILRNTNVERLPEDLHLLKLEVIDIEGTPLVGNNKIVSALKTHVKKVYAEDRDVISNEGSIKSEN